MHRENPLTPAEWTIQAGSPSLRAAPGAPAAATEPAEPSLPSGSRPPIGWRALILASVAGLVFSASAVAVCLLVVRAKLGRRDTQVPPDEVRHAPDKPQPAARSVAAAPEPPAPAPMSLHSRYPVDAEAAKRGEKALTGRSFTTGVWTADAYRNAWKRWGNLKEAPERYAETFQRRYGVHPAPYPNGELPMGLREAPGLFGKSIATDCLLCHGGSIFGQSYVGLGNATLDIQALFEDLAAVSGLPARTPFPFSHVRGTTEAGSMSVYLLSMRDPDLRLRPGGVDLEVRENLVEDVPAWWLLKKKQTMYHTGGADARSVRSIMQFMMGSINPPSAFEKEETTFRDIRQHLLSLRPPKYPFPIDEPLAKKGEALFGKSCARCHGTYGDNWTYPNRLVPLAEIGTDPARARGISDKFIAYYNQSWFAREEPGWLGDGYPARQAAGYQAPPLDGVWATAPYFHNGSAPTLYNVLNSKDRPKVFTRSFRTGKEDYDAVKVGWKVQTFNRAPDPSLPAAERRQIYDTAQPGRSNAGHTFGDRLTQDERRAVIEYLKTL